MDRLITIDGPSASGKSSLSRCLAQKLNWKWVSTGVFYRGLAKMALEQNVQTEREIASLAYKEDWSVQLHKDQTFFFYKGKNITKYIYTDEVDEMASLLAGFSLVREALLPSQQDCFKHNKEGLVAEGRDCGTVVFPFASLKIYLTADENLRAQRRTQQRKTGTLKQTMDLQKKRDRQDLYRKKSPLREPEGAFYIDTGSCNFKEMVLKAYKRSCELFEALES